MNNQATNARPLEMPAEVRLDERVERILAIDEELNKLQRERVELCEEVDKLRETLIHKLEEAQSAVQGTLKQEAQSSGRL